MNHDFKFTQEKLEKRLQLVHAHRFLHRAPIPEFSCQLLDSAHVDVTAINFDPTPKSHKVHAGDYWIGQQENFLLQARISAPPTGLLDTALYLPLGNMGDIFNHPEALVRINTQIVGSTDRYHHLVRLPQFLGDDTELDIQLQGWTGLTGWPINTDDKSKLQFGHCALVKLSEPIEAFLCLADAALQTARYLKQDPKTRDALLDVLDRSFIELATDQPGTQHWFESAEQAYEVLNNGLKSIGGSSDVTLHGIGHAHIDIAYLWTTAQTRLKNARTCSNQLQLMNRFDQFKFSHSQPAMYEWLERDFPTLFNDIKSRVSEGRWEVLGGMWVEADTNMPGPESLVRQFLLSRQWCDEHINGADTRVLWLPDTFGFSWCLPQLIKSAGLDGMVTSKLNWNQTNQIPTSSHRWRGIDGTEVLTHVLTTPRPVEHLPFPTNYKSDLSAEEIGGTWNAATSPIKLKDLPICYGYGDGGGGPNESLVRVAQAYGDMPMMPVFEPSTVKQFLEILKEHEKLLPCWDDEHYLEAHRGTFTSQAWIKQANRQMEGRLQSLEAFSVMCERSVNTKELWKSLCLNQFHDILPGSVIHEAMQDARDDFTTMNREVDELMGKISGNHPHQKLAILNTTPWVTTRLLKLTNPPANCTLNQKVAGEHYLCLAECQPYSLTSIDQLNIPDLTEHKALNVVPIKNGFLISNSWLKIEINNSGQLSSILDKSQRREILHNGPGNQWQVFEDRPLIWDSWDIEPYFEDRMTCLDGPCELELTLNGPLVVEVTVNRSWRNSTFTQQIRMYRHTRRIDFVTRVNWHEDHHLLKVCFPVNIRNRRALFDIQWGYIDRPTHRNTSWDQARFEVPAQKWACLQESGYSVALLNDCKYGYDVKDGQLRLTLIKSASFPDETADIGLHTFTYSLLASDDVSIEGINKEAWDINSPALIVPEPNGCRNNLHQGFINCSNSTIEVQTVKPAEYCEGFVIRLYESNGSHATTMLEFLIEMSSIEMCNILEDPIEKLATNCKQIELTLSPFQIVSLLCVPSMPNQIEEQK